MLLEILSIDLSPHPSRMASLWALATAPAATVNAIFGGPLSPLDLVNAGLES